LKHNFLHRDIKPGNILSTPTTNPSWFDFGLACKADLEHSSEEAAWGNALLCRARKNPAEAETFLSDLYSLGGTLYHALTGHVPFEAPTVDEVVAAHVHTP